MTAKLTAQTEALLEAMKKADLQPLDEMEPSEARLQFARMIAARRASVTPVARVEDRAIAAGDREIATRFYWPDRAGPLPAIIYCHGGGHVIGNIDTHDEITRGYCAGAGALVLSVDYRKGPEHKFPAAVDDVLSLLDWIHANAGALNVDSGRVAIAGDSAGGNLAAVGAFHVRDSGLPQLALQLLVYPVVDYTMSTDSYRRFARGYGVVSADAMAWFRRHYLAAPSDALDWRASPIRAKSFEGLAPALVISAECDVLFDEGVRYVELLRTGGVQVEHEIYSGVIHGFFAMPSLIDEARMAHALAVSRLRAAFA